MLGGVGEGFLDDAERGQVDAGVQPGGPALDGQLDGDPGGASAVGEPVDAREAGLGLVVLGAGQPAELGERLARDGLDQVHALLGARGVALGDAVRAPGLDRDHADVVRDRVVQLARDAHALARHRGARLAGATALDLQALLPPRARQVAVAAHDAPDGPRQRHPAEQRGHHAVGIEDRRVDRGPRRDQPQPGQVRARPRVRADRVGGDDHREDVAERERAEVEHHALQADREQHCRRNRNGPPAPPQQRHRDRHGGQRRGRAVGDRELGRRHNQHRRGEQAIGERLTTAQRPGAGAGRRRSGCGRGPSRAGRGPCERGGRGQRRRERGRLAVVAEDAQHAPHVAERGSGGGGDRGEPFAGRMVIAGAQLDSQGLGVADDRPQPAGDGDLEVRGDSCAFLLSRMTRVARAVTRATRGLVGELALEEALAARPAPDQQGAGDRRDGQQRLTRRLRRRVGGDARGGDDQSDRPRKA